MREPQEAYLYIFIFLSEKLHGIGSLFLMLVCFTSFRQIKENPSPPPPIEIDLEQGESSLLQIWVASSSSADLGCLLVFCRSGQFPAKSMELVPMEEVNEDSTPDEGVVEALLLSFALPMSALKGGSSTTITHSIQTTFIRDSR